MRELKNKNGISLIVLVITIIVMIILATAIILSLDSSNIVEKAKEAKTASDLANAKNVVILAKGEWELMTTAEQTANGGSFASYAESKLQEAGYKVNENNGLNVSSKGVVSTVYVGNDNRTAIIPEGFKVSSKSTEDSVTEGLVIIDDKGNEFVWVPVDDFSKFERTTTYDGTITAPGSSCAEPATNVCSNPNDSGVGCSDDIITLSLTNDLTGEWSEYTAMRASVKENKGFYIARYEAGKEGTNTLVSKKGIAVWNNILWGESMTEIGTEGAVYYSRNMYKGSSSVVSTLCYGVQWDSALQFIAKTDAEYPLDSTGKGHYAFDEHGNGTDVEVQLAGLNDDYAINNIYDMAGNIWEWTMEANSNYYRVYRGAESAFDGARNPASFRNWYLPNDVIEYYGFRVALYLK